MSQSTAEYRDKIQTARQQGDRQALQDLVTQVFEESGADERLLAWVAQVVYEEDLQPGHELLPRFLQRFPDSTAQVRVFLADTMAEQGMFDSSSEEARAYLAGLRRAGDLSTAAADPAQSDWLLHALQLLPGSLIAAGARHRAQEIYTRAIGLSNDPGWTLNFEQEISFLDSELSEFDNREVDYYWRRFFEQGDALSQVLKACEERGTPMLAVRVRLLHERCMQDGAWTMPAEADYWLLEGDGQGGHRLSD